MSDHHSPDDRPYTSQRPRTKSGWLYDCEVCGKGAAFGFTGPKGDTHYCSEHRHLGRGVASAPMARTTRPQ